MSEADRNNRPWKVLYGRGVPPGSGAPNDLPLVDRTQLANRHALYGFNFVPLVTQELDLTCSIDILFLRPDKPGHVVWGGDIDNRLKTLLDAMRIPEAGEDYTNRTPEANEAPFYCLLEDDRLITRVSVETDTLLEPVSGTFDASDARLIVKVSLQSQVIAPHNVEFLTFELPNHKG